MTGAPDFTIVLRGYDRAEVDSYLDRAARFDSSEPPPPPPDFKLVLRGYEKTQVDAYISRLQSGDQPSSRSLAMPKFTIVLRGYEVTEVDRFVGEACARIAELERTIERLQATE